MDHENKSKPKVKPKWGLIGAVTAAIAASLCCIGPLVLVALGIGGAWASSLSVFQPYRPILIIITFLFLGFAFFKVYKSPNDADCKEGTYCANPKADKMNKIILWSVAALIVSMLIFPNIIGALASKPQIPDKEVQTNRITLEVKGMTCAACPVTVTKSLKKLDGVQEVNTMLSPPEATVVYDPNKVSIKQLVEATTNAGYPSVIKGGI